MQRFLLLAQSREIVLLDSNQYWYHIVKAESPKQAFDYLVEELSAWNEYNNKESFIPKRFHLFSDPNEVLNDSEVARYVESISYKKIRNNYVVCLFLNNNRFIFYCPLR